MSVFTSNKTHVRPTGALFPSNFLSITRNSARAPNSPPPHPEVRNALRQVARELGIDEHGVVWFIDAFNEALYMSTPKPDEELNRGHEDFFCCDNAADAAEFRTLLAFVQIYMRINPTSVYYSRVDEDAVAENDEQEEHPWLRPATRIETPELHRFDVLFLALRALVTHHKKDLGIVFEDVYDEIQTKLKDGGDPQMTNFDVLGAYTVHATYNYPARFGFSFENAEAGII